MKPSKNIHVIPTSQPSRLLRAKSNGNIFLDHHKDFVFDAKYWEYLNIYITSDEEIKGGDWFISSGLIYKVNANVNLINPNKDKKIILTTDQDLIKDGVQAIDDEFLEWFVKNPSCEEVKVEGHIYKGQDETDYRIIIPKECMITKIMQMDAKMAYDSLPKQEILLEDVFNEEKKKGVKELIDNHKQETLEEFCIEFVKKHFEDERTYNPSSIITAMKVSAKWQQEQIGKSEFLQRLRATLSDAEARRLIFETFKNK